MASFAETILEVSDFVALVNQTFEYAYPTVTIRGELANFKISKNKWVYFDLKDDTATVRFFGTVHALSGPLEDGMRLRVRSTPKLHPQYGFSVTVFSIQPEGEGTIRRAADLLKAKLAAEGLFDETRKRQLPYPPERIGLVTSTESAAYADFMKILNTRWRGLIIECIDVQVQGEAAPAQIVAAIEQFGRASILPDVLVVTRGGGSPEDLYAFSSEQVARSIAASRVPTLVAIGHEIDTSLAELAADRRASTPSNAAELLVPDQRDIVLQLGHFARRLREAALYTIRTERYMLTQQQATLGNYLSGALVHSRQQLTTFMQLLDALNPRAIMRRGYAIVRLRNNALLVRRRSDAHRGDMLTIEVSDGSVIDAVVE